MFEEKVTKIFSNSKNTVSVRYRNKFRSHSVSTFHGILISAGRAETTMTSERNKFEFITTRASIHGAAKGGIPAIDHFIHVFDNRITWMQCINHFLVMVDKNIF